MNIYTKISLGALSLVMAGAVAIPALASTKAYDATCIKAAIGNRDTSIQEAFDTFYKSSSSTLTTRTSALQLAWDISDEQSRKNSLHDAWGTYNSAVLTNKSQLKQSREAAWTKYKADRLQCHVSSDGHDQRSDNI